MFAVQEVFPVPPLETTRVADSPAALVAFVAVVAKVARVARVAKVARVALVAEPAFVAEAAFVAYPAFVAEPADNVDCATQEGAVAPAFTTMTCPAVPRVRNVVVSAAVLYGTRPAAPPAMLVAFVARVALVAFVAELAFVADPALVA